MRPITILRARLHLARLEWRATMRLDPCVYCGAEARGLDHIAARTRGGPDALDNRAAACTRCDQLKGRAPLLVFLWAAERSRRRVARRPNLRTVQQRVSAWQSSVLNLLRGFNTGAPS